MTCECGRTALVRISASRSPRSLVAQRHKIVSKRDHPLCRLCVRPLLLKPTIVSRGKERTYMTQQEALHYLAPRCIKGRPHTGTVFDSVGPIRYVGYVDQQGTVHPCGSGASYAVAICAARCEARCPSRR